MEATDNKTEQKKHSIKIRETEVDIIKGASDTSNIDAMRENATQGFMQTDLPGTSQASFNGKHGPKTIEDR